MLDEKVAVIYGAGSIGSAVAKAFVAAGSQVYVASRTQAPLDALADAIRASGGELHAAIVDALDPTSVREHADRVAARGRPHRYLLQPHRPW
jgi:3-oxoacyl-[acyl-carrier protein] reductase